MASPDFRRTTGSSREEHHGNEHRRDKAIKEKISSAQDMISQHPVEAGQSLQPQGEYLTNFLR
jgi:hypothetical protein